MKKNRHRLDGMLAEIEKLIESRETETGVTTAQAIMGTTDDKILLKLRASRDKIKGKLTGLDEEYPDLRSEKDEVAQARKVADVMETKVDKKSLAKVKTDSDKEAGPEEKALRLLKEKIRAFEMPHANQSDAMLETISFVQKSSAPISAAVLGKRIHDAKGVEDYQLSYLDHFKA